MSTRPVPIFATIAVALVVGGLFLSFSIDQIKTRYSGNPSGPLLISRGRFLRSPMADRADVRSSVRVIDGPGSDGQFFYFITFDPFLSQFRRSPERYGDFIDAPPYRYGRIGFSLLTRVFSRGRPTAYPLTMLALVAIALGMCGALLATIAHQHGRSVRYGALILLVPGFWRSAEGVLPEPLAVACLLAASVCLMRRNAWAAGLLLGLSMLIRETGGALVLAVAAGLWLDGQRRAGVLVLLAAFVPVVLWKIFVASVFWPEYGVRGLMPTPNDVGWPFAGVWHLWTLLARGEYYPTVPEMARGAMVYPIVTMGGVALAGWAAAKRLGPFATAAAFYAALTITYNYEGVWLHLAPAERLTTELFVALALVFVQLGRDDLALRRAFAVFWTVTACYIFFLTFEASEIRQSLFRNLISLGS